VYLPPGTRAVERGNHWWRSGEQGGNLKLCSRGNNSLRCYLQAKMAVCFPQLPLPRDVFWGGDGLTGFKMCGDEGKAENTM